MTLDVEKYRFGIIRRSFLAVPLPLRALALIKFHASRRTLSVEGYPFQREDANFLMNYALKGGGYNVEWVRPNMPHAVRPHSLDRLHIRDTRRRSHDPEEGAAACHDLFDQRCHLFGLKTLDATPLHKELMACSDDRLRFLHMVTDWMAGDLARHFATMTSRRQRRRRRAGR